MSPVVRVGVGVFVCFNGLFLIGHRIGSHGAGKIQLPGGHLEFLESFEDCAAREVKEETGLEITNVKFLTATNDIMFEDKKHYVTVFMLCDCVGENPKPLLLEPEKCTGWEWITFERLIELDKNFLFQPLISLLMTRPKDISYLNNIKSD